MFTNRSLVPSFVCARSQPKGFCCIYKEPYSYNFILRPNLCNDQQIYVPTTTMTLGWRSFGVAAASEVNRTAVRAGQMRRQATVTDP